MQALNKFELEPHREDVARFVPSEYQALFVWDVVCTLAKGLFKDLLMIFAIHIGHQFLDLLVFYLECLIAKYANSARVALGDVAKFVWFS